MFSAIAQNFIEDGILMHYVNIRLHVEASLVPRPEEEEEKEAGNEPHL